MRITCITRRRANRSGPRPRARTAEVKCLDTLGPIQRASATPERETGASNSASRATSTSSSTSRRTRSEALLPRQDVDRAHAPPAHHVTEPHARVLHLPPPRLTPQLQRRLPDLRQPRRPPRVPARDEPPVGRHRPPPTQREVTALDRPL